jgi:hypothetical protein
MHASNEREQRNRHATDVLLIALGLILLFAALAGAGWMLWELVKEKPAELIVMLASAGLAGVYCE